MSLDFARRHIHAILTAAFMVGLVVVGLNMQPPDHDAVLDAAMADLVAHGTLSGTVRVETLVPSDLLGLSLPDVPVIRLPIGVTGPFRIGLGKDVAPIFAAELSLALEGGETLASAPGVDLVTDGHDATYLRPRNLSVESVNGRWMRMTSQEFAMLTGGDAIVTDDDAVAPRDPDFAPLLALLGDGIVRVDRKLAPEDIAGRPMRHYRVVPIPESMMAFIEAVHTQFLGRALLDADRAALAESMAGFTLVAEAWIDKDAPVLRRFGFDLRPVEGNDAAPIRVIIDLGPADVPLEDRIPDGATGLMEAFLAVPGLVGTPS